MSDIDAIRARHVAHGHADGGACIDCEGLATLWCDECPKPWPCDTVVVLAALDRFIERYDRTIAAAADAVTDRDIIEDERDAAIARADKAEAALDAYDKRGIAALQDAVHARLEAEAALRAAHRALRRCAYLLHERSPQHSRPAFDACPECREWLVPPAEADAALARLAEVVGAVLAQAEHSTTSDLWEYELQRLRAALAAHDEATK